MWLVHPLYICIDSLGHCWLAPIVYLLTHPLYLHHLTFLVHLTKSSSFEFHNVLLSSKHGYIPSFKLVPSFPLPFLSVKILTLGLGLSWRTRYVSCFELCWCWRGCLKFLLWLCSLMYSAASSLLIHLQCKSNTHVMRLTSMRFQHRVSADRSLGSKIAYDVVTY